MFKTRGGGGGGQRPFKQCLKKLHNWHMMASLSWVILMMIIIIWSLWWWSLSPTNSKIWKLKTEISCSQMLQLRHQSWVWVLGGGEPLFKGSSLPPANFRPFCDQGWNKRSPPHYPDRDLAFWGSLAVTSYLKPILVARWQQEDSKGVPTVPLSNQTRWYNWTPCSCRWCSWTPSWRPN